MADTTPFIDKNSALDAFEESRKWMRRYLEPVDELFRIARNKPSPKITEELPKVTDGTTAAIIQETPKRVIMQVPTGLVECKAYPEYAMLADVALTDELIPMSRKGGSYLQKSWLMLGGAMTVGRSTSYTFLTHLNGKVYTDFTPIWVKDMFSEKGKAFAPDSNIRFMRSWYQKRDLQAIINREKALQDKNKKYQSEWDLKALAEFMEAGASAKKAEDQTPAEQERGGDSGGYEVIHAFQNGTGAHFFSMNTKGKVLRVKPNKDPRGLMPFDDLYCNIDQSNPLGRGIVEISGGVQNLMDQQLQMFSFQNTLSMGPPLKVWGNVNKAKLKFAPNAIWEMGASRQNNDVEPYAPDNQFIANFVANQQFLQSKLYNLNNSQDTSIGAQNGDANQSKTQAGVNAQMQKLGISDNYLRKQYEEWFSRQSETSINIYFSEMTGTQKLALSNDQLKEIAKTPASQYVEGREVTIPYNKINDVVFHFTVNANTSEIKEDSDNAEKLVQVYDLMLKDPDPSIVAKRTKLLKVLVDEIGAEGTDELFPEEEVGPDGQPAQPQGQQPQMTPEMIQQMVVQTVQQIMQSQDMQSKQQQNDLKARELNLKEQQFHADTILKADKQAHDTQLAVANHLQQGEQAQMQAAQDAQQPTNDQPDQSADELGQLRPEEQQIAQELLNRGFDENDVEQAIVMLRRGMPAQQIIQVLGAKQGVPA